MSEDVAQNKEESRHGKMNLKGFLMKQNKCKIGANEQKRKSKQ